MDDEHGEAPGEQTLQFRALTDEPADHDAAQPPTEAKPEAQPEADTEVDAEADTSADAEVDTGADEIPEPGKPEEAAPVVEARPWAFAPHDARSEADDAASEESGAAAAAFSAFVAQAERRSAAPVAEVRAWAFAAQDAKSEADDAAPEGAEEESSEQEVPAAESDSEGTAAESDSEGAATESESAGAAESSEGEIEAEGSGGEVEAEGAGAGSVPREGVAEGTSDGPGAAAEQEEELPAEAAQALMSAIGALRESIAGLRFGLDLPGADEAKQERADLLAQLEDYVLPRVRMKAAPALIVIAGSTGAGKSTLVNSLAERNVSRTGVRRPTTGVPVLVCHPDDEKWFAEGELLGGLRRIDKPTADAGLRSLMVVATEKLPQGVALLDTPDIDSVVEEHHEIAHRMLDAADLWIFVTTAARYADAPAWNLLRLAKERGARLAIVLSRVQPKARDVVLKHFVRMLTEYGLGEIERFVISESKVADGKLPDSEVTDLRLWLAELSVDEARRTLAVKETLNGVLDSFRTRVPALARHLETQVAVRGDLRGDVDSAFMSALTEIDKAFRSGTLIHGEVLARWQDFSGSGDLMRSLQLRRNGRVGKQASERIIAFRAALRAGLESVIVAAANRASEEVIGRWRHRAEVGATIGEGMDKPSDDLLRHAGRAVAAWQEHVTELVRTEGVAKRSVSKLVSFDADSLSLIFMVAMFSGGRAEGVPHRLVKALLGAESLRGIGAKALSDLRARIGMLFDEESMRYVQALDSAGIPDESAATRLYQATYNLEVAR
ncbi:GTPase [Nonomuraea sp. NPDC049714]|uniref:GTPase n=1 Tax=Nonomuraea sp. NPDC049714 TaxID=3364357 RepID=UPI0037B02478